MANRLLGPVVRSHAPCAVRRLVAVFAAGVAFALFVAAPATAELFYHDVTEGSGLEFRHDNGAAGEKNYNEVMGSGVALLDYDGDGRLDVYCVNSVGPNRLYRNVGEMLFEEVPRAAGAADADRYGMGAVASDFDNDGDPDLYVTNFGANVLFRNDGGKFVAVEAGVEDRRWSCGAAFVDFDRDGWLDLYVTNYVEVAEPDTMHCPAKTGESLYCGPRRYPRAMDGLFRNLGDGTFEDVSAAAGIEVVEGRALGVVTLDYDRDGWPDIYVANDLDPNFLFRNLGDGTFEEVGVLTGVSHSEDGVEESGMGVAAADYDRDGWVDLFVTNYLAETNTLYHNEQDGFFLDESASSQLGPASLPWVGWGTEFFDYDLDGWLDVFVANGHTESEPQLVDPTTTWPQPDFLYRNQGDGRFLDMTAEAAPSSQERRVGRGVAFGDLDDDGDTDLVISNQLGRARLWQNVGANGRPWIGVETAGTKSNRDGTGARIEVHTADGIQVRERQAGASYLSSNDPRLNFGVGAAGAVDSLVVEWPSGARSVLVAPAVNTYHRVEEPAE